MKKFNKTNVLKQVFIIGFINIFFLIENMGLNIFFKIMMFKIIYTIRVNVVLEQHIIFKAKYEENIFQNIDFN